MFKVGDIVVCRDFPRNVNGIEKDSDPNITIDKSYIIVEIHNKYEHVDLQMLQIIGEKGLAWYWSDYFYSKLELRKQKLNKIYSKLEI